jgi:Ni,Fe-hydrogenase I cytochrome b subunit
MMNSENSDKNENAPKDKNKVVVQLIWGIALTLAGIGVFIRIPQVMPRIEEIEQFASVMFFIRFSLYLLGMLLIGGGLKKIYINSAIFKDR